MAGERTRRLVDEMSPEEQGELGDLQPVAQRLAGYVAPEPSPADTARLLAHLRPLVAARLGAWPENGQESAQCLFKAPAATGVGYWLRLAWSQTTLMEPAFWWASGVVLVLGLLIGAIDGAAAILFALLAPVMAAATVAYAFRPATRSLWELERICPIQPLELIYARLGLVLAFDLGFTLAALGPVWLQEPRVVLWRLVIAWLGPMLALAGIALYATVRWGAMAGAAAPLALWAALVFGWLEWAGRETGLPDQQLLERLLAFLTESNGVLSASAVALAVGLGLIRQAGRLAAGGRTA